MKMVNDTVLTTNTTNYFNINVRTIHHFFRIFKERGTVERPYGLRRPKITTPTEDVRTLRLAC